MSKWNAASVPPGTQSMANVSPRTRKTIGPDWAGGPPTARDGGGPGAVASVSSAGELQPPSTRLVRRKGQGMRADARMGRLLKEGWPT